MDYLQYQKHPNVDYVKLEVLNLIINGLPSIPQKENIAYNGTGLLNSFKPYYKWITFNTISASLKRFKALHGKF